jgi:hypothetical protein
MATLSSIITPTNIVTAASTTTLTNKTLTAPTIASANLTTALTLAGAAGTNGQVLTSAGSGLPSWITPAAGALTFLSSVTASNSSTVDVETTFDSTYSVYMLVGSGIRLNTDNTALNVRMKISGSYATTDYKWILGNITNTSANNAYLGRTSGGDTETTVLRIGHELGNSSTSGQYNMVMYIYVPSSTTLKKTISWTGTSINSANEICNQGGVGQSNSTGALTGIRFLPATGLIQIGTFRLYGIANS